MSQTPVRRVSSETLEFHRKALIIDLHTDSLVVSRMLGRDLAKRHAAPNGFRPWMLHADVPRLKEAALDALFFGIVTHPWPRGAHDRAMDNLRYGRYVIAKNAGSLVLATSPSQIEEARASGRIAVLFGVEGMHMLSGESASIEEFYDLGARYITLAHFTSNAFAVSSADPFVKDARISAKGAEAVEMMNRLGMMIDVAHVHPGVIRDVCRLSTGPVIVSHGATQALRPTFRNLSDSDIIGVAGTGGVIGLIYASEWLFEGSDDPGVGVIVDHADHIRKVAGIDHIALGSDWDGFIAMPRGMRDVTDLPVLTQAFFDRGYSGEDVEKILGLNFMRVFRQVEGAAPGPL
jgi:membrane dipeptidase